MAEAVTVESIDRRIDRLTEALEKGLQPASRGGTTPNQAFSKETGLSAHAGWGAPTHTWPEEKLKALQAYDSSAVDLICRKGGRNSERRLSGIGPYLCKMAGLTAKAVNHTDTLNILKNQNLFEDNYGQEQFEKEFHVRSAGRPYITKGFDGREVRKAALAEGAGQTGGYTVPPQFLTELMTIAAEDGFIENRAKVIPMNSRTLTIPMLDITTAQAAGTSPYFGGILAAWQPEASLINETEPAFRQSEWVAWDLVMYTVSSNQLLADNGIGLDALLTQLFGQAMTWYKEFAFLRGLGAGSSMPLGVLNAPATYVQGRSVTTKFKLTDAAAMMSHLQVRSWDDACWVMHQSVLPELIQMNDASLSAATASTSSPQGNRLVWMNPTMPGASGPAANKLPNAFLNGLPLYFTEKVPSLGSRGDVSLIDWSRYVIGQRLDVQIDTSPHFLFRNNQLAWRVVARCDGRPWLNSTITDAEGFTVSPFVTLAA